MITAKQQLLDGLKQAMQAERTGQHFYATAALTTQDPTGREVFEQLAREEAEHFAFLASHYRSINENGVLSDAKLPAHGLVVAESPIFSTALRERIKDAHFEMSALAIAVQLELNGVKYYRAQAALATVPEVRKLFEELAAWETAHYEAFSRQQQSLYEDYWSDAGFNRF